MLRGALCLSQRARKKKFCQVGESRNMLFAKNLHSDAELGVKFQFQNSNSIKKVHPRRRTEHYAIC